MTITGLTVIDPCDINGDGTCDVRDIDVITQRVIDGLATAEQRTALIEDAAPVGFHTYLGDSNLDGRFDEQDLVDAFIVGKYLSDRQAHWADGDWNGDQVFDQEDFVAAFIAGGYLAAPRSAFRMNLIRLDIMASDTVHSSSVERSKARFAIPWLDRQADSDSKSTKHLPKNIAAAIAEDVIAHFRFYDMKDQVVPTPTSIETKPETSMKHTDRTIAIESILQELEGDNI